MTPLQKVIKYLAIAFALFLTISIVGGILSVVGLFAGLFAGDAVTEDEKTYSVTSEIRNLNIQINAADLSIQEGDVLSVTSNLKYLKVTENGDTLTIEETKKFSGNYNGATLTLCIPTGAVFDRINLTTGAGKLTVESLSSQTLDFELGAGDVSIMSLSSTKSADIEGGAGRITISGGALKNLDLEMGVGQLNLTSALTGKCDLETGVGESNITILGSEDDYKLDIDKGIGSVTVNGKPASDFENSGNGQHTIHIDCGVGSVHLAFKEEKAK